MTYASNRSTILTGDRYKLKERRISTQHTLHTLMPDPDEKIGVGHAFVKKYEPKVPTVLDKNNQPTRNFLEPEQESIGKINEQPTNHTEYQDNEDVFGWGVSSTLGSVSANTTRSYFGDSRTLPPELTNPEAHPSPFRDTTKKGKNPQMTSQLVNVKKAVVTGDSSLVAANYDSASDDDSDPENPSCLSFCDTGDSKKVIPQAPRKKSSSSTPSDARRDFTVLNSLFDKAVMKKD